MLNAADVMTRSPSTTRAGALLSDAVWLMLDRHVSGLPVVDTAHRVVGMLTEGDLLRRAEIGTDQHANWLQKLFLPGQQAERFVHTHGRRVREVMAQDVVSVEEATPLSEIASLMQAKRIKRVPVVRNGRLIGLVARADLLRALSEVLERPVVPLDDATIKSRLTTELDGYEWCPEGITVTVANGHVGLHGSLLDEKDRMAIRVAAENIPGVLSVDDHLVFVEPTSGMAFSPDERL